jgi:hypothetical protein
VRANHKTGFRNTLDLDVNDQGTEYERRADLLTAFLHLGCVLICARKLKPL